MLPEVSLLNQSRHFEEKDTSASSHHNIEDLINLEGMMIVEEVSYQFSGKKDTSGNLVFTTRLDEISYIKVIRKVSDSGQKFTFEIVENNKIIDKSEVKIESSQNRTKITLTNEENQIHFTKGVKDGQTIIEISALFDGVEMTILANEQGENIYQYTVNGGQTYSKDCHHGNC